MELLITSLKLDPNQLTRGYGSVFSVYGLLSNEEFVGKLEMGSPSNFGQIIGALRIV